MLKRVVKIATCTTRAIFVRGAVMGGLALLAACTPSGTPVEQTTTLALTATTTTVSPTTTLKPVVGEAIAVGVVFTDSAKMRALYAAPDSIDGIEAATNVPGGGVAGRPLLLVPCTAKADVALKKCVKTFSEADVYGVVVANDDAFSLKALEKMAKDFPVVVANPSRISTLTSRSVLAVTAGFPGLAQGMAIAARNELKADTVAVVHFGDAESNAMYQSVVRAVSVKLGAKPTNITEVVLQAGGSAKEMSKAFAATKSVASVVVSLVSGTACNQMQTWITEQEVAPRVVAIDSCAGQISPSKLNGWFVAHYGNNSSRDAVRRAVSAVANVLAVRPVRGLSAPTFGSLMNSASSATEPFQETPICGKVAVYPALCSSKMGIARLVDGAREDVRGGSGSPAIDLFADLEVVGS